MFEVCICPEDEILSIRCKTFEKAKERTKEYYPDAYFMEIDTGKMQTAIYDRFDMDYNKMNHIGNIWKV